MFRPTRRIEPREGQESVWDYPRPPAVVPDDRLVEVWFEGRAVASTRAAVRVLETSHPPGYYLPPDDVDLDVLVPSGRRTVCEWKGSASYWTLEVEGRRSVDAAWSYPKPTPGFAGLAGYLSFYPDRVDSCTVGGDVVQAQEGGFYGGWVLPEIVGPFKGAPGTLGW